MKKIEKNDLLQIIGMLGLIASLIFVGMELRQNQQVARVTAYQALAEQIASYNALLLSEPEIIRIRISALNNENLNDDEKEMYRAFFRMLKRQSELAYLQYENGIINEELLIRSLGALRDHVTRSNFAESLWNNSTQRLSEQLGYVPTFEAYFDRVNEAK